ncbi:VanZ family protein [Arenibacter sp. GZD96]|uniref:VanZ family protein n=1 Tax=Aurantibrevibacter litoralis TaxID=3106030 RepID=UPI002AFF6460|nr:VanZ family protein [Arenibacter sp. GZD-96]MEA1784629.1 VanZ family protein [Arenibacter sp. GZD-96]
MAKFKFKFLFFGWLILITFLSLDSFEGLDTGGFNIPHLDKAVHFTFYFVAALLGCLALREQTNGHWNIVKTSIYVFLFCILYGIIIEVIQTNYTETRQGESWDVLANSVGALAGLMVLKILFSGKSGIKWKI